MGFDAQSYLDAFPAALVAEIHLAGHTPRSQTRHGAAGRLARCTGRCRCLALFERLIARIGQRPTLIERDGNLPAFDELLAERTHADAVLRSSVPALLAA